MDLLITPVRKSEVVAVEAINVLIDAVQPMTAAIPGMTPPLAYDLAGQLMATQRKFAEDVFRATARLTPASPKKATAAQK